MKHLIAFMMIFLLFASNKTEAKLKVVTTTSDLGALAGEVGRDKVDVISLGKGYQNPHNVPAKPSFMAKMQNADVFIRIGMDLDIWSNLLLDGCRNDRIYKNAPGNIDASKGCDILEIPTTKIDKSQGDIHIYGNPHYWLDPMNGIKMMDNICKGFSKVDPEDAKYFNANKELYEKEIKTSLQGWLKQMEPYKGRKIVTYHNSWPNFAKRFGLDIVGYIEPKPGVPPTANDIANLISVMKEEHAKIIIMEPYFSEQVPKLVAEKTGATVLILPPSVGGAEGVNTYTDLFNYNIGKLVAAFKKS